MGWPSPPGGPCARPPPGVAYPNPLQGSLVLHHSFRLHSSLCSAASLCCSAISIRLSAALLPSLAAPLLDLQLPPSPSRSSRRRRGDGGIERTAARRRRNRADSGEEKAESSGIDEETAESRGVSMRIRQQGAALPLRRAWSAPTLKRRLSDALITLDNI